MSSIQAIRFDGGQERIHAFAPQAAMRWVSHGSAGLALPGRKSFFLVPIVHEMDLLAVFYADYVRSNEQGWTSEELEVAEPIKRVVCVALQKERT